MRGTILACSIVCCLPHNALAWGTEGHQIIALIAARELTPVARSEIEKLLGGSAERAMVDASMWADEIRPHRRETAPWHFVDIPATSSGYNALRDCPRNDCVVAQIESEKQIIADRRLLPPVRAEALRFLIHFVGDLHQPLHAADNRDRGGNDIRVVIGSKRTNLHSVWDGDVIGALGPNANAIATQSEQEIAARRRVWQQGSVPDWANETFQMARQEIYAHITAGTATPIILSPDYARIESQPAKMQLAKAGVRLGNLLNSALR